MHRKINRVGNNTFTVSLPIDWIRKNELDSHSSLFVEEREKELVISPERSSQSLKINLNLSGKSSYNKKIIIQAYKKGFDDICISFDNPNTLKDVTDVLGVLVGFEIVEEGKNFLRLKSLAAKIDEDVEKLLERVMLVTSGMLEDMQEGLAKKDLEIFDKVIKSEQVNNRLCLLSERIISKCGYIPQQKASPFVVVLLYKMENIADTYKIICREVIKNKALLNDKLLAKTMSKLVDYQKHLISYYRKSDFQKLSEIHNTKVSFLQETIKAMEKQKPSLVFCLSLLLQVALSIYDLFGILVSIRLE